MKKLDDLLETAKKICEVKVAGKKQLKEFFGDCKKTFEEVETRTTKMKSCLEEA